MNKKKIFIAVDTNKISIAKRIIRDTQTNKIKIGYKFGLEFLRFLVASASQMASAELLMPSARELESLQLLVFIFKDLEKREREVRHVSKQHFSVY